MKQFTPEAKHEILLEYRSHSTTHSFAALAARHGVTGGRRTIENWLRRWKGTAASLQHRVGAGRPHILTPSEVRRHIVTPIRRSNRGARRVTYTHLADTVRRATGKDVSDRTVRRIGKGELEAKKKRGKKRTADECKHAHI